jgi:hypothetical protein
MRIKQITVELMPDTTETFVDDLGIFPIREYHLAQGDVFHAYLNVDDMRNIHVHNSSGMMELLSIARSIA